MRIVFNAERPSQWWQLTRAVLTKTTFLHISGITGTVYWTLNLTIATSLTFGISPHFSKATQPSQCPSLSRHLLFRQPTSHTYHKSNLVAASIPRDSSWMWSRHDNFSNCDAVVVSLKNFRSEMRVLSSSELQKSVHKIYFQCRVKLSMMTTDTNRTDCGLYFSVINEKFTVFSKTTQR